VQQATRVELIINIARPHGPATFAGSRRRGDRVKRREFISLLGGAAAAWPLAARAQQRAMPVVGHLNVASLMPYSHLLAAFRDSLKRAGWTEGVNVAFEYGWAEGDYDRLPMLAADLVRRQVTVIVASGGNAPAQAAKAATDIIPIVFVSGGEPVRGGLVASMNRPGANVTGVSTMFSALVPKRLDLLKQLVPTMNVVGALINPNYPDADLQRQELDDAAAAIGQQVRLREASSGPEIEAAFASFADSHVDAVIAMNDPFFQGFNHQIAALAAHYALPAIYWDREFTASGGLVSYGPSLTDAFRQAAIYVARILRGEKPGDLPVQQPTKFELVLNLKAATKLRLEVPPTLLAIADEVIE
jgi:putative ABC transport system substrate-binding protein